MGSGVDAQRAARRRLQGGGDVVGVFKISEYLRAAIVVGLPTSVRLTLRVVRWSSPAPSRSSSA